MRNGRETGTAVHKNKHNTNDNMISGKLMLEKKRGKKKVVNVVI